MKQLLYTLFAASLVLCLAGCQTPRTTGMETGATVVDQALAPFLVVNDNTMARYPVVRSANANVRQDGLLFAQLEIQSLAKRDYAFQYQFVWLDATGMELYPGKRAAQQNIIHGGEVLRLQAVSPDASAKTFIVRIRPDIRY